VKVESENVGLKLNIQKMDVCKQSKQATIFIKTTLYLKHWPIGPSVKSVIIILENTEKNMWPKIRQSSSIRL